MATSTARTLADHLRGWSAEQLSALLEARPDLAVPAPADSAQLAARAVTRTSVLRVLDGLDRAALGVLDLHDTRTLACSTSCLLTYSQSKQ